MTPDSPLLLLPGASIQWCPGCMLVRFVGALDSYERAARVIHLPDAALPVHVVTAGV